MHLTMAEHAHELVHAWPHRMLQIHIYAACVHYICVLGIASNHIRFNNGEGQWFSCWARNPLSNRVYAHFLESPSVAPAGL